MSSQKRNLPDWLDGFLKYTETVETASIYRKWVGIMCLSSALQRKVKVDWGVGLKFYPNFYIILVGKSAAGKGTAMRPALDIMKEISGIQLSAQATSLQALIVVYKNVLLLFFLQMLNKLLLSFYVHCESCYYDLN